MFNGCCYGYCFGYCLFSYWLVCCVAIICVLLCVLVCLGWWFGLVLGVDLVGGLVVLMWLSNVCFGFVGCLLFIACCGLVLV